MAGREYPAVTEVGPEEWGRVCGADTSARRDGDLPVAGVCERHRESVTGGAGLGLTIVSKIIYEYGGRIRWRVSRGRARCCGCWERYLTVAAR